MPTVVTDTFTDTAGTVLDAHVGETGATWAEHPINASADMRVTDANRITSFAAGAAGSFYYASGSLAANGYVEAVVRAVSLPGAGYIGVTGRMATGTSDFYWAIYNLGAGGWQLWKSVSGTGTQLGSTYSQTLSAGNDYTLRLRMVGTSIALYVDGVSRIAVTDGDVTAAGKAGAVGYGAWDSATGLHLASLTAYSLETLHAVGDSIAEGQNASSAANEWATLFAADLGYVLSNNAVGGTQIVDQTSDDRSGARNQVYLGTSIPTYDAWSWLIGYNDMRYFGTDADGLEAFTRVFRSGIAWMSRAASDCKQASDAGWTFSGAWTDVTVNGLDTSYSSTSGDTASISVSGTAVTVAYISRWGIADGGTFSVTIDGNLVAASVDTNFGENSGYGGGSLTRYAPMALRFDGLAAGSHTVLLTLTSSAVVQVAFVTGSGETETPTVYAGGPLKMNSTGYSSYSPYNLGSDAAVAAYAGAIRSVLIDAVADGRDVKYADVNAYYSITEVDTDNVHPADTGHDHIRDAFVAATAPSGFSVAWARGSNVLIGVTA